MSDKERQKGTIVLDKLYINNFSLQCPDPQNKVHLQVYIAPFLGSGEKVKHTGI